VGLVTAAWLAIGHMAGLPGAGRALWADDSATARASTDPVARGFLSAAADQPIDVQADELVYDRQGAWVEAKGNVVVRKGDQVLRADYVRVNTETEEAYALGNVVMTRAEEVWKGQSLTYNFGSGKGSADKLTVEAKPYRLLDSRKMDKGEGSVFVLHDATVTTCVHDPPQTHYTVKAREVTVVPGDYMKGKGAVWRFGRVPVMYLPYWYRDLNDNFGWRFYPGHSSRHGTYLLSSYRYRLNPRLRGETHLDYRSKRGLASGQDLKWRDETWVGDLSLYYADDQEPIDDDEDAETADIDSERYRLRFRHQVSLSARDLLYFNAHYLSDTDVLEDFFEREYRALNQPENYAAYTHRDDRYTANLRFQSRLNDFYSNVNRLPELSFDFVRQQIRESDFYYEGETSLANLEQVWEEEDDEEDYSSVRLDSAHTVYRPFRRLGFLNLIPRAGYQGTYYSKTLEPRTVTATTTAQETNLVVAADGSTNTVVTTVSDTSSGVEESEGSSGFRSRLELGLEASFKAFKTWGGVEAPRRHVAEPYANYTFVPEPTLVPAELYQFDSVDELDEEHYVKLGMRNKIQTKRESLPYDLLDVDTYTYLKLERDDDDDAIESVYMDAELRPWDWVAIDLDGEYSVADSELDEFNTQVSLSPGDLWTAGLEHRYSNGDSSLLEGEMTLSPNRGWSFNYYGRYEFEEGRLEEQGGYVQRNLDCMVIRTGLGIIPGYTRSDGTERDDEWRVLLAFWLTAFPEFEISGSQRY